MNAAYYGMLKNMEKPAHWQETFDIESTTVFNLNRQEQRS
ncbi:hypothetical protein CZ787_08670 [Halomonas citrativorans]|uniref:Uncharacterized protein n=1 Tax=Halomonas citrativorans TaxID=2742612 RepID=A0A1R4HYU6_9GAMM|nr:hypothetical protein CZ787_08670 [Halomonas citrativorans]